MKIRIIMFLSLLMLLGMWWWSTKDQEAKVIFCDVGQGDGILIKKYTEEILIDTGPPNQKILSCLEKYIPFWDKTIEVMILSHGDSDHTGGVRDILKSYRVENVFNNEALEALIEQNIYSIKLKQNNIVRMGEFQFEVANPSNLEENILGENDNSITGVLSYKDTKIFFSGDINSEVEQRLVWQKVLQNRVDILKVSHHGSSEGTSQEVLEILKPKMAVISVGENNKFGHPTKEVFERLKNNGVEIRRTDKQGDIVINLE